MSIFKSSGERRVEGATWGLLLIWTGVAIAWNHPPRGIGFIVAGGIMLASALTQKILGWDAGIVLWAGGIALLVSGINDRLGEKRNLPALAVALILFGLWIVVRALSGGKRRHAGFTIVRGHDRDDRA